MKRILVAISVLFLFIAGCKTISDYHEGNGKAWILEQVEKGNLTPEEVEELMKQEDKN